MGLLRQVRRPAARWTGRMAAGARAWSGNRWLYGQRRRFATAAAAALALGVGYHVVFGHNGLTAYRQKQQETQSLDQQTHTLELENERLRGHVDRLQNDPGAIERQAREDLHYARQGEVIVSLPPDDAGTRKAATRPAR